MAIIIVTSYYNNYPHRNQRNNGAHPIGEPDFGAPDQGPDGELIYNIKLDSKARRSALRFHLCFSCEKRRMVLDTTGCWVRCKVPAKHIRD